MTTKPLSLENVLKSADTKKDFREMYIGEPPAPDPTLIDDGPTQTGVCSQVELCITRHLEAINKRFSTLETENAKQLRRIELIQDSVDEHDTQIHGNEDDVGLVLGVKGLQQANVYQDPILPQVFNFPFIRGSLKEYHKPNWFSNKKVRELDLSKGLVAGRVYPIWVENVYGFDLVLRSSAGGLFHFPPEILKKDSQGIILATAKIGTNGAKLGHRVSKDSFAFGEKINVK